MERSGLFYVRFMDDILVIAPNRWRLRKAVKAVNEVLDSLCLLIPKVLDKDPWYKAPRQDLRWQDRERLRFPRLIRARGW